jgi:hypothetical protein
MKRFLLFGLLAFSLASCAPRVMNKTIIKEITKKLPPLEDTTEVTVYELGDNAPEHSEIIGAIALSQKSDWKTALEIAKKEARAVGGNGLEIQSFIYPTKELSIQRLTAAILNINDSIAPIERSPFDKTDFNDLIVTKENDTIPCKIIYDQNKRNGFIILVYDYNNFGYVKSLRIDKNDLLSYHVEDPEALAERQKRINRGVIHKKVFTVQMVADCGLPSNGGDGGYLLGGKIRFQSNYKFTLGVNYDYFTIPGNHFIAGSVGLSGVSLSRPQRTRLEQILDCGCDEEREIMAKNRYFVDFFVGYYIDNRYTYPKKGLGIGIALAYDRMITDHFGIGIDLSVYPIINMSKFGYLSADYTTLNLKTGIRYYF